MPIASYRNERLPMTRVEKDCVHLLLLQEDLQRNGFPEKVEAVVNLAGNNLMDMTNR